MEQAGTVGKRRAVPVHDRSPLDPIIGSGLKICGFEMRNFGLNSRQSYTSAKMFFSMRAQETTRTPNESRHLVSLHAAPIVPQ
jgi:hypothetical protein